MKKLVVNRFKLVQLWNTLTNLNISKDKALTFYIVRNIKSWRPEIDSIQAQQESIKPSKEFNEYESKRIELGKKYAEKSDNDFEPIISNGVFVFSQANREKWQEEYNKLTEEYHEVISQQDKSINVFNSIMREDIEIEYYPIPYELLPDDINIDIVFDIVKETDEEIEQIIINSLEKNREIPKINSENAADAEPKYPIPPGG